MSKLIAAVAFLGALGVLAPLPMSGTADAQAQPADPAPADPAPADPAPADPAPADPAPADPAPANPPPVEPAPAEPAPAAEPSVEQPALTPPTGAPATEDDDDLEDIEPLDLSGDLEKPGNTPLELYGFADIGYYAPLISNDNLWNLLLDSYNEFSVGNVNLYLRKKFDQRWTMLSEIRFLFLPNGTPQDGSSVATSTTESDPSPNRSESELRWGAIELERIYIEYEAHPYVKIRAGRWLTPYGIWNIDHGTPVLVTPWRPYNSSLQLFPEHQTGLQVRGDYPVGELSLGYAATVSNGRGPQDEYRDLDHDKAVGGRLSLSGQTLGSWRLGASYYRGQYTERERTTYSGSGPQDPVIAQFDEQAFGTDLQWFYKGLELRAEFNLNERRYNDDARHAANASEDGGGAVAFPGASPTDFIPDFRRWGYYVIAGYRFPWRGAMPYVMLDHVSMGDIPFASQAREARIYGVGIQARPTPSVTAKLVYVYADTVRPTDVDSGQFAQAQLAWAF